MRPAALRTFSVALLLATLVPPGIAQGTPSPTGDTPDIPNSIPIYLVHPVFPQSHKKKTQRGEIILRAKVGFDGVVKDVSIESGDPTLAELAATAVRQWRYLPAMRSGAFVETPLEISISYLLGKAVSQPGEPISAAPRTPKEDLLSDIESGGWFRGTANGEGAPTPLQSPDPEYSERARVDRFEGSLLLGVVVGIDGKPQDIWVVRPLGHGLDERAIQAVCSWLFAPAKRNGKAVPAFVNVEVSFRVSDGYEPQFEYKVSSPK